MAIYADPLLDAAEQLAPAPPSTNFFDPTDAQNIISRYGNSRIGLQESEALAGATSRLTQSRFDRIRQNRADQAWDRDEQDFLDKQDFKAQRGEFLSQIGQIDPTADDYLDQRDALLAGLPKEALEDDAFQAILSSRDQKARELIAQRDREDYQRRAIESRSLGQEQKLATRWASMGLPPDELESLRDPVTGELDVVEASFLAGERARSLKADTVRQAQDFRREMKAEKDLTAAEKELRTVTKESLADTTAFVPQLESLRSRLDPKNKLSNKDLQAKDPAAYEAATSWDRNQFNSELEAARDSTEEEYVAKGGGKLTDDQKSKRRRLWKVAQTAFTNDAPPAEVTTPTPAATVAETLPSLTLVVGKRYTDKNGNVKRYLGDGKWE